MTPNDYQRRALATALPAALDAVYLTLGLCGEAGEVAELLKKAIRDGKKPDHADRLRRELGDVLWYVAVLAHVSGSTLEDVMAANVAKLSARQATGNLGGSGDYRGEAGFGSTGTGPAAAPATVPVALTRRSPEAARAYHEGHATALRSIAGWLREKADTSEKIAATFGVIARLCADGGSDDDDRARMEARIRALEAAVAEARAEAAQWAAELDGERAAVVAALRRSSNHGPAGLSLVDLDSIADAIAAGEHRAGGAR